MRNRRIAPPLLLLLLALLFSAGCGKRERPLDPAPRRAVMERGMARMERDAMRLKGSAPGFKGTSLGERDRYIVTKAAMIEYCSRGGKMQEFLRGLSIRPEDWKFLDDFYWMDPTVRAEVEREISPPAAD